MVYQKHSQKATVRFLRRAAAFCILAGCCFSSVAAPKSGEPTNNPPLIVTCDHADGIYSEGESVHWRIEAKPDELTNFLKTSYAIKLGGLTVLRDGPLVLADGAGEIVVTNAKVGTLLLDIRVHTRDDKKTKVLAGAVVSPERIKPSAPRPKDFDVFWQVKLKELSKIPADPQLVAMPSERKNVGYWQLSMANIHGIHVRAQLAVQTNGGKFPAMMIMEGAGVHGLKKSWVTSPAAKGWIALNFSPHDIPIDQSDDFYDQQTRGALKEYWTMGNDDREKSYFLQMYLGCCRCAKYLTERPEWDGKTLLMYGGSQGGLQALMTASLNPEVTAVIANVPAGCDMLGPEVGRRPGWPAWYDHTKDKDAAKVHNASRYFDIVNFASRIQCPVLVSAGLIDETCPAAGILAAMNQVKGPKEVVILPHSDHMGVNHSQLLFTERSHIWQAALLSGKPVPVGK